MRGVHQLSPAAGKADAVGAHTLQVRQLLLDAGYRSEIFTTHARPGVAHLVRDADEWHRYRHHDDLVIYQFAVGSLLVDQLAAVRPPLLVNHHNLTPEHFFAAWDPDQLRGVMWGRRQLEQMAQWSRGGLADSRHNALDMMASGFRDVEVTPIILDTAEFGRTRDEALTQQLRSEGFVRWLFVGRVAPHKAQHDLVMAFAAYREAYDRHAVLDIVGSPASERYSVALDRLIDAVDVRDSIRVWGRVGDTELAALYAAADVFVCLSEHEGFCVPLLEAMHHDVPIVAYGSTAVPETLGGAGLVLPEKSATFVAAAVSRVLTDGALRHTLVEAGHQRLEHYSRERTRRIFLDAVERHLAAL